MVVLARHELAHQHGEHDLARFRQSLQQITLSSHQHGINISINIIGVWRKLYNYGLNVTCMGKLIYLSASYWNHDDIMLDMLLKEYLTHEMMSHISGWSMARSRWEGWDTHAKQKHKNRVMINEHYLKAGQEEGGVFLMYVVYKNIDINQHIS